MSRGTTHVWAGQRKASVPAPAFALALLLALAAALSGCDEAYTETVDGLPRCEACHASRALTTGPGALPAREWASKAGNGLTRKDVLIQPPEPRLVYRWPRRGRHAEADLERCAGCHPADAYGRGHGIAQYPLDVRELAFGGGQDCAARCHAWLGEDERPAALLSDQGAHARIFRQGFREDSGELWVTRLRPGCAGCHNVANEIHGTITGCLDCHRFGGEQGELHREHLEHAHPADCGTCHPTGDPRDQRHRAACYNCHGGGHRP